MEQSFYWWTGFNIFILTMLALDLGVFHRKSKEITVKEAFLWTGFWITLAFIFNIIVYYAQGEDKAFEFFTGYLIEKSLSADSIFVIILISVYDFYKRQDPVGHNQLEINFKNILRWQFAHIVQAFSFC